MQVDKKYKQFDLRICFKKMEGIEIIKNKYKIRQIMLFAILKNNVISEIMEAKKFSFTD